LIVGGTVVPTVRVKLCVAGEPTAFVALIVKTNGDPVVFSGVPERVAVLAPGLVVSDAQGGKLPETTEKSVTGGVAVVVTVNVPGTLTVNEALLALVIVGLCCTVRVNA
jgi:hypothetical protein